MTPTVARGRYPRVLRVRPKNESALKFALESDRLPNPSKCGAEKRGRSRYTEIALSAAQEPFGSGPLALGERCAGEDTWPRQSLS